MNDGGMKSWGVLRACDGWSMLTGIVGHMQDASQSSGSSVQARLWLATLLHESAYAVRARGRGHDSGRTAVRCAPPRSTTHVEEPVRE